jgi:ATP/maltotriose-dependent transcriptional regulator MalT
MLYPATLPNLDNLWNDRDPHLMENKLRYLVEPAAITARCYYLQLLTQIARAQAAQGKYATAHATLDSIEAELSDGVDAARVRCLIERARVYLLQGDSELAASILKRASQRTGFYYPHLAQQVRQLLERAEALCGVA